MTSHHLLLALPGPLVRAAGRRLLDALRTGLEGALRRAQAGDLDGLDERALRDIGMADRMRAGSMPMREIRAAYERQRRDADASALDRGGPP